MGSAGVVPCRRGVAGRVPGRGERALTVTTATTSACTAPVSSWPVPQRVEQLLMVSGEFSDLGASTSLAAAGVGGFVLFGQPAAGSGPAIRSGLASLDASAAEHGQLVPWMATDEEGGPVARLSNVIGALPAPRQMAAEWTPAQVQSALTNHTLAMRSLGVTMDLAPVLDTANPDNTIAGENYRSFSENGEVAATYGLAFADGLLAGGVVPVAKHFPGLGHASADTDTAPATDPPLSQLETDDLIPFEAAPAAGLPVIMVGHPMVPGLTGNIPASLSPATYQLLHGTLRFDGVAMTDDLDARAISAAGYTQPAAAVKAIEAGADMAMIDASQWSATVSALSKAVNSGKLPLANLDASVNRILAAKGIIVSPSPAAVEDAATGRNVFYVGSDHSIHQLAVQDNRWTNYDLGGSVACGTGPAAVEDAATGRNVFYVGSDHSIHQLAVQNNRWTNHDLGGSVAPTSSPAVIEDAATGRNVFYVGSDHSIHQLAVQNNRWTNHDLGGSVAPTSSPAVIEDAATGRNVFYVGSDHSIHQLAVQNNRWTNHDLGGSVAPTSSPAVIEDAATGRNVFYVGSDHSIHQLAVQNNRWTNHDLGGSVAPTSSPAVIEDRPPAATSSTWAATTPSTSSPCRTTAGPTTTSAARWPPPAARPSSRTRPPAATSSTWAATTPSTS